MWAVAAQPQAGFTPMIPTPSGDSGIAHGRCHRCPREVARLHSCKRNYPTPTRSRMQVLSRRDEGRLAEGRVGSAAEEGDRFPAVAGDDGAVWAESIAEWLELLRRGRRVEVPGKPVALSDAEVVDRPDVEPAELEHQVHL